MKRLLIVLCFLSLAFAQREIEIDAITHYFDGDVDSTLQSMNSSDGRLYMIEVQNPNNDDMWLHFYDASSITFGTTTPDFSFLIAEADQYHTSTVINFAPYGVAFETAIKYAAGTTATGGADPTTGLRLNAVYKDE